MGHNELLFVLSMLLIASGFGLLYFVYRTARSLDSELQRQRALTKELSTNVDRRRGESNA